MVLTKLINIIESNNDLTENQLSKYCDEILNKNSSENTVQELFTKLCNFLIEDHKVNSKLNSIKAIKILVSKDQKVTDLHIFALEIALKDSNVNGIAAEIVYKIIQKQKDLVITPSLVTSIEHSLQDTPDTVKHYGLYSLYLIVKSQNNYTLSAETITYLEFLLNLELNLELEENYKKCKIIILIFLYISNKNYEPGLKQLEAFSKLLCVDINSENEMEINVYAAYVVKSICKKPLFKNLTSTILSNFGKCFNTCAAKHDDLRKCFFEILVHVNADHKTFELLNIDLKLLLNYLKDKNLNIDQKENVTHIIGRLCAYSDFKFENSILLDLLVDNLNFPKLIPSSVHALKNMLENCDNATVLNDLAVQNIADLFKNSKNTNEIRKNCGWILVKSLEYNLNWLTESELKSFEAALGDTDDDICIIAINFYQHLFNTRLIDLKKIFEAASELLSSSNEIVCYNAINLLESIASGYEKGFLNQSHHAIRNISEALQTHRNEHIRKNCLKILILINQSVKRESLNDLIQIEKLAIDFLDENSYNERKEIENTLNVYLNNLLFETKNTVSINLASLFVKILQWPIEGITILNFLLIYIQNSNKIPNELITILGQKLDDTNRDLLIEILYYIVFNGQLLDDKTVLKLESYLNSTDDPSSKYIINTMKLLLSRNQITTSENLLDQLSIIIKKDNNNNQRLNSFETLAYAIQNIPVDGKKFKIKKEIIDLFESFFLNCSGNLKFFSLIGLVALSERGEKFSNELLDFLKIFVQDDNDTNEIDVDDKRYMRDLSIKILENYLVSCSNKEKLELRNIIEQEKLGNIIYLENNNELKMNALKDLLNLLKKKGDNYSLSKFNKNVLEQCLANNDSIEVKNLVITIFEHQINYMTEKEIDLVISHLDNKLTVENVMNLIKSLVDLKKTISNSSLQVMINFALHDENKNSRHLALKLLEKIISYSQIEMAQLKIINLEKIALKLQNIDSKEGQIIDLVEEFSNNYFNSNLKLSKNTLDSFLLILSNPKENIELLNSILFIIEDAITNNRLDSESNLMSALNQLIKEGKIYKARLIRILNLQNESIPQEVLNNFENDIVLDENFDYSIDILLKSTQDGLSLSDKTLNHLVRISSNKNLDANKNIKIMKIFKNLSENLKLSSKNVSIIDYLENSFMIQNLEIQKLALNALKYISNYKPTKRFFENLAKIVVSHPLKNLIEHVLANLSKISIQKLLHVIHVSLLVQYSLLEIQSKPINLLCRELLCTDLLGRIKTHDEYDELEKFKFYSNLAKLEDYFKYEDFSIFRDEIILFLIEIQENFKLNEINNILMLIKTNDRALDIIYSKSKTWLKQLHGNWFQQVLIKYPHIAPKTSFKLKDVDEIIDYLLIQLNFDIFASECLLERISNLKSFEELKSFFIFLIKIPEHYKVHLHECFSKKQENKIEIKNVQNWQFEIECNLIKKEFAKFCASQRHINENIRKEIESNLEMAHRNNWSLEVYQKLFKILEKNSKEPIDVLMENFLNAHIIINNYSINQNDLDNNDNSPIDIFSIINSNDWPQAMQKFAVSTTFDDDVREKSLKDLIDELKK